ncbi:peptide ABC transporter permease [Alicyclobacillus contaminans]|uniref:ABC transporter permease n=1 Tax=Alicyclobacillus contaminans TaxID=392016 RepID=UPI0003F95E15|nr:ABC transporter permease [Alicyclobacillus contaminans]GMA50368.1 peptide ABC transporter permease [Alicyclobacillus contaminans]
MAGYVVRRLFGMIPMLFAITVFVFFMMHMAPGNAIEAMINPRIKDIAALKHQLEVQNGLNLPLPVQYWRWLVNVLHGNFGWSFGQHEPVIELLGPAMYNTLILAVLAEAFILLLGIPIGIWQARRPYSKLDYTVSTVSFVLFSVPFFVFAVFLIYFFAIRWPVFPAQNATGTGPLAGTLLDHVWHALLPAISIALTAHTVYSRYTRGAMLDVARQDYVRTARAKGIREPVIYRKHVFRNARIPLVTQLGFDLGGLLGGAVITEGLFSYQGMGYVTITAVSQRDYPVIMATTLIFAVCVLLGNLVADILNAVVDPRIRYQ